MSGIAEKLKEILDRAEKMQMWDEVEKPVEVHDVKCFGRFYQESAHCPTGRFVSIRPCAKEYEGKTFLGIMIGDIGCRHTVFFDPEKKELAVYFGSNPAIFVPDLNKVIFGYESWWGEIEGPDDLKQITTETIQNQWYVQALKALEEEKNATASPDGGSGGGEQESVGTELDSPEESS